MIWIESPKGAPLFLQSIPQPTDSLGATFLDGVLHASDHHPHSHRRKRIPQFQLVNRTQHWRAARFESLLVMQNGHSRPRR